MTDAENQAICGGATPECQGQDGRYCLSGQELFRLYGHNADRHC